MKSIGYSKVYASETAKVRSVLGPYFEKYGVQSIVDVGCGTDKLTTQAFGVDGRALPGVDYVTHNQNDIYSLSSLLLPLVGRVKIVYSSHVLEHLQYDVAALLDWSKLVDDDGILFLYLPDDDLYDNDSNPEHIHRYTYEGFVARFAEGGDLSQFKLLDHGRDVGFDKYSFWVVFRKY